jgi:hypothetical protein
MKYSNLTIADIPKSFNLAYAVDYIQPLPADANP